MLPADLARPWLDPAWIAHSGVLLDSFARLLGKELLDRGDTPEDDARRLFEAPFVAVSHDTSLDPLLNYANRTALTLWEIDIPTLLRTPSRLTAEPLHRDERARLLARTAANGFVDDYRSVRISSTGKRFRIERAIVWNLTDAAGKRVGQGATFGSWTPLPEAG